MAVQNQWNPLPRAEVVKALEGGRPSRVPLVRARWWGEGLGEQYGSRLREFDKYPEDTVTLWANPLNVGAMNLSWSMDSTRRGHDSRCVISDWVQLDEFIEKMPSPDSDPDIGALMEQAENARSRDMYILYGWWGLFFERPWGLRGMENIMTDYHVHPEEVARLHEALARQYCRYIEWGARNLSPDGFWTSDDLGHQTQLMMRPGTFRDLIKPSYAHVGETLAKHSMHWWLHSCGDNTEVLGDLAETGVNVFHPVQKGTMDEIAVAREFGDRMTFLAGLDVQHILQEADTDGVRAEVRFLIDTFDRPEGGMCLGAGNGIVNGTPFENIDAFLDEAVTYGAEHRARYADGA
jgi:uroporphyrinogen decarboxylase